MRLLSTTTLAGMLALAMAGCGSSETDNNAAVKPTNSAPQPAQQPEPKTEPKTLEQPTVVAQKPEKTGSSSAAGLIQPTNPNQRTQQVQKGRSDPFAGLFTIDPPQVATKPKVPPLPKLPVTPPPKPIIPPAPPQPDLARGVTVLGVVEVGSQFQAIVQVPNEATSRYVSEGQRLSDGQILVKRIEINPGSEPFVVLEQNGIEVTRAVGEELNKPEDNQAAQPTAVIPVPLSPATNPSSVAELNNVLLQQERSPAAIRAPLPPASKPPSSAKSVPPPPPTATPSSEAELQSHLELDRPPIATPELLSSPPAAIPSSETELQSHLNPDQPPAATLVPPSALASRSVSRAELEGKLETELESHLDDVDYPPPAIRVSATPPSSRQMAVEKLRRRLKLN